MAAPAARAALALALLAVPALAAAPSGGEVRLAWALVPESAPDPGLPLAFRLAVEGPPHAALELRAWLAGPGLRGAQVWDGAAWARADRYQLTWVLDADGRAEGWVAVRAREAGEGPWSLGARAREPGGRVVADVHRPLGAPDGERRAAAVPGAAALGAWDGERLLAVAPVHGYAAWDPPWDLPGHAALRAPAGAELRALDAQGAVLAAVRQPSPAALRIEALLVDPIGADEAEFVRVRNAGPHAADLAGWWLAGPGWRAALGSGTLGPGAEAAVARDPAAYRAATGRDDALAARGADAMRLPNAGGVVELGLGEALFDAVAWGRGEPERGWMGPPLPLHGPGELHARLPGGADTDAAADWDPAPRRAGWSAREPLSLAVEAAAFPADRAYAAALGLLAMARATVLLEVYTFTHPGLAAALLDALARGVRVGVLVEGAPVGGTPEAQRALLDALALAGAEVRSIGGSGRDRYASAHAKFLVVDGAWALVGSENWTPSGFPAHGGGNLGWAAVVRSPPLAAALAAVWAEDADALREDVRPWAPRAGAAPPRPPPPGAGALPDLAPAGATLLLAPDHALPEVQALLGRATATLDVEALQLPLAWSEGPNPVLEGLRAAAARGVRVRVLLDGPPGSEHAAVRDALEEWAAAAGADLEVRLERERRVHNKGVLVDGAEALVGSLNFGEAALTRNREAALLLRGPPVADLQAAFEADWQAAAPPGAPARADPGLLAAPLGALAALAVWRGRRK